MIDPVTSAGNPPGAGSFPPPPVQPPALPPPNDKPEKPKEKKAKCVGNPKLLQLLACDEHGRVAAMPIENLGCVVHFSDGNGTAAVFVPHVRIVDDENGGRKLVAIR